MPEDRSYNKEKDSTKLRFGILCDGLIFKKWQVRVIESLLNSGIAELSLLVINSSESEKSGFLKKFGNRFYYRNYIRFISKPDALKKVDLSKKFREVSALECTIVRKGKHSEYFSGEDICKIKNYNLDFILRFGFNIIRGDILKSAKYGVWSYHHGDEEKYRGGPPGFWEIYFNDSVNGAILQKLTDRLDSGIILKKGYFKTVDHSYAGNIDKLFLGCTSWPLQVCKDIKNDVADYLFYSPSPTNASVYQRPSNAKMIKFMAKIVANKLRFHYQELFKSEQWNIGIIHESLVNLIDYGIPENEIHWMPLQKPTNFRADCFAYDDDDQLNIFFEDYDYKSRKGKISKVSYSEVSDFSKHSTVLEKEYHLAYPYLLNVEGKLYLIPESCENKSVDIYRIDTISGQASFHKTILNNTDAVDSTLLKFNEKWWLFCTMSSDESNTKLHLFYADTFDGNYTAHPANPVKTDIRNSRPAGKPFINSGALYRVAQDSSDTYGGKIAINKISKLNEFAFEEETVGYIGSFKNSGFDKGVHTICEAGEYTILDAKRFIFVGSAFRFQLIRKIKKMFSIKGNGK
jgi:hypothetical protein